MDFRRLPGLFLSGLVLGLLVVTLTSADRSVAAKMSDPPNIILILTDDQRWDTLAYMPIVSSELVANGTYFPNAYVTTPLCCPSRASILTGQYASNHGVLLNGGPDGGQNLNERRTIATHLQSEAGYRTGFVGKYLNNYTNIGSRPYIPPGWDEWIAFKQRSLIHALYYDYVLNENGKLVLYGNDPADYSADVLTKKAVDFIRDESDKPFFLFLAYYASHAPFLPAPRHEGLLEGIEFGRPPNFLEPESEEKPAWYGDRPRVDPERLDRDRQRSLESLLAVDEGIATIIEELRRLDKVDNTVIFFMSDNGMNWGEHGLRGKNCPYEECVRVPLVVWYPAQTSGQAVREMALNIDIAPTIAELAGVPNSDTLEWDGLNLADLILFGQDPGFSRDEFLVEHWVWPANSTGALIPDFVSLHTAKWSYVVYTSTGERELYNLVNDPYELDNLVFDPEYGDVAAKMESRLQWSRCHHFGVAQQCGTR
jgi:arylsulfatase A-like enzyme